MSRVARYFTALSWTQHQKLTALPNFARKMSSLKGPSEIVEYPKHEKIDGVFTNPWGNKPTMDGLKLILTTRYQTLKLPIKGESIETVRAVKFDKELVSKTDKPHFSWLGHASCYYQTDGVYFLTDPIFSQRASFSQWFGPARLTPTPVTVPDLEKLDVVLLSHTHYDHMDETTVRQIGNKPLWIVPLGVKDLLKKDYNITNCVELGWWESHNYVTPNGVSIEVAFTPTKHWTARSAFDRNTCLWGSWSVLSPTSRFFFTGDTAFDAQLFKTVGAKYGPFDLAAVPIGAYAPRWFMEHVHCNPEEAVQIHKDLRAKQSVGIHWATFRLTEEDPVEPALELARLRKEQNIPASEFFTMALGETVNVGKTSSHDLGEARPDLYNAYVESLVESVKTK